MKAVLFLALVADASAPVLTRVEAKIDLATLSISQARDLHGSRQRVRVWRYDNDTEHDGRALVECWHARDVHCLLILRRGKEMPTHGRFIVEGILRVWNVPSYRINGTLIEGWTMSRIENASVLNKRH